jgi:glycosyltransferase involved in cell wall biosynthesis
MQPPLVSIITPFYNAEKYLSAAIDSVLSQTYHNWELIMINDGSADTSLAIAESYRDSRIKILSQENSGQCTATNNALRNAQGDYIQLLDADDIMDPNKTKYQVEHLSLFSDEHLGVSKWAFFHEQISDAIFKQEPIFFSGESVDWLYQLWTHDTMMHTNSYMMPRKLWEKGGKYFDENLKLNIDFEFFTRMTLASKGVVYTENAIGYYRKGVKGSKTHNPSIEKQLSALDARVRSIRKLFSIDQSKKSQQAARMAITILTFSFPDILPQAKKYINELGLEHFGSFKGKYFKYITYFLGFETAIRAKKIYSQFR